MQRLLPVVTALWLSVSVHAEIVTRTISYQAGDKKMEGFLAYDDTKQGKHPGVLVIPEWWGVNQYVKGRARQLAELGYVAFVADMYGEGKSTDDPRQAGEWAGEAKQPGEIRSRAQAALDTLVKQESVSPDQLASIGFCFGGMASLELAYSGALLKGVVSFHGNMPALSMEDASKLKARILVLHGADDPFVKPEEQQAFRESLRDAKADWQLVLFSGAKHSYTNPQASGLGMEGVGYNEKAATRAWKYMQDFFDEIFH